MVKTIGNVRMERTHPTETLKREPISRFIFDMDKNLYVHPDNCTIDYQDGGESYILESLKKVHDLSSHSLEFRQYIKDWPSRYHFTHQRINFLEGIKEVLPKDAEVLEIGSGCGIITRWLGEQYRSVDALEGNAQRAAITRYRTKDLENVKVYCGNLLATDFDKKYDIITLIGSLEYLPLYDTENDDPKGTCTALLTRLHGALRENGILLIAIENKFGAKYFSGCKEDHTGRMFDGIIGYPDKTPVTFSRNEMGSILSQTGFENNFFYHVFPDYKMTETIIPENPEVLSLYPYNWIRTPFEDYSGNRLTLFPDLLFLKSITDSGLLWQFSNSFVILARPTKTSNLAVPWLIKSYKNNENLNPAFYHVMTLDRKLNTSHQKKGYLVRRSPLPTAYQTDSSGNFEFRLIDNNYIPGELLIHDFYTALFKRSPENALMQLLEELHNNLLRNYSIDGKDPEGYPLVRGVAIDFTFWNLIIESPHNFNFIDRKWRCKDPLPADLILFRNLFNIFERCCPYLANKNKISFILEMIQSIYPEYSEKRLATALDFESLFQVFASGRSPQNFTVNNSVEYSLAELETHLQERSNRIEELEREMTSTITSLQQVIASKDQQVGEISVKADSLERQLAETNNQVEEISVKADSLERQLAGTNNNVKTLTESLSLKENQLRDVTSRLNDRELKLSSIEQSIIWQFTLKFHNKIVERLLPQNTQRRKYYDLGRAGGKILINDGFRAFYQSVGSYLNKNSDLNDYQKWIQKNEPAPDELNHLKKSSLNFSYQPKISILIPVWNTDEKWLRLAIVSVINQIYDNWELCIVDGGLTKRHLQQVLKGYAQKDPRIKIKILEENKGIAGNSNEVLSLATGEFVGFLDHDDELAPFALHDVVSLLNQNQNFEFIYSDEDTIDQKGNRTAPFFKPDWSPDLFLSQNYLGHFSVIRKTLIDSVGGFRTGYDGSQDYDLFLRCTEKIFPATIAHIPKIIYHRRIIPDSAADQSDVKPDAIPSAKKALEDALIRRGLQGEVIEGYFPSSYRVCYAIQDYPRISIIIPTKDHVDTLKRCVQSILDKTAYQNYEIVIIDNQSSEQETLDYYKSLATNPKTKILHYDKLFNFSAINNYAVTQVDSPYILFLNNDTEVISEEWLSAMLEHAQRDCVGAVGAKLLYPNNLIQHAGVILGITGTPGQKGVAEHSHKYLPNNCGGYFFRSQIIGNYSAVTAACMMMRRGVFLEMGGFNEDFTIAFNDLDLCLKIRRAGYLIIYTPYSLLYHHESLSRGYDNTPEKQARFSREITLIRELWGTVIDKDDPYYNPNLTLERQDFSIKI
jgi:GT2 family glycosyltransferase